MCFKGLDMWQQILEALEKILLISGVATSNLLVKKSDIRSRDLELKSTEL